MNIHSSALQILGIVEKGGYTAESGKWVDIGVLQAAAVRQTELLRPDELDLLFARGHRDAAHGSKGAMRVEVIDATTQEAAHDLSREPGGVVLLNFASARNPGGGFLGGAKAQEEEVCRCSGLYSALVTQREYYDANRENRSALYTDHMIYSRDVPFFRTSAKTPFLDEPFVASVITAPAPNAGALMQNEPQALSQVKETFERRWRNVLTVAEARGHRTVLLGAWGCGAFRNDPEMAASTVSLWLRSPRFSGSFDKVVFAIPGSGRSQENLNVFRKHFGR